MLNRKEQYIENEGIIKHVSMDDIDDNCETDAMWIEVDKFINKELKYIQSKCLNI